MSSHLKAELAATCSTLGRLHKGEYLIEPDCIESVKDLIRYLKRDNESHDIRRYLGESKVLQNDLIHIIKSCSSNTPELFDVTLRLLINLTTPTMLMYGEELPAEKTGRNIYLSLINYEQEYKNAFYDVDFWNQICGRLTTLFEIDWAERSADDGIQIERMLMLLRNVLQVPADVESEKRPENDITVHDKVLWSLRQSQILELLLFVTSNPNEDQYFLNLLEIFSLILRELNPKVLAVCDISRSVTEKNKDTDDLVRVREMEKKNQNKYLSTRNFNTTFVVKGVKSMSSNDIVCHRPLEKVFDMDITNLSKKQVRARRNRIPVESERLERRSTFSVRLFLKEFCTEFLNCSFNHLMNVVKNRLDSGKSLVHDQSYYFWALNFFLDFAVASNSDVSLIKECLSTQTFHFVQTSMDNAFEHLQADKKKTVNWVKRIHLILKAYQSLLETLLWMDCSKNPLIRSISREIKSDIFYVVEYREMTLNVLLKYDSSKFSLSYLKDLLLTTHLFIKLLEEYAKQTKLVVQKVMRKKSSKKKKSKKEEVEVETREQKWEKIKDDVYDTLSSETLFPEIPPFDAASDVPIDNQKGRAMKRIQKLLHQGNIKDGIGLLRSARQVWPENDYFGAENMAVEDETMALQEICLADLEGVEGSDKEEQPCAVNEKNEEEESYDEEEEEEDQIQVVEQDFDILDYKKRLANKKVVEGCSMLLKNYKKNSDHTNHCAVKLLHRIGWECCTPALLYQASLFWTLLKIMKDKSRKFDEINTFTANLMRKFRKDASKNPVVFLELLFWKEHNVAMEIQHGYVPYEEKQKPTKRSKKKKSKGKESYLNSEGEHSDEEMGEDGFNLIKTFESSVVSEDGPPEDKNVKKRSRKTKEQKEKKKTKEQKEKKKTKEQKEKKNTKQKNRKTKGKSGKDPANVTNTDLVLGIGITEETESHLNFDNSDDEVYPRGRKDCRRNLIFNNSDEEAEELKENENTLEAVNSSDDEIAKVEKSALAGNKPSKDSDAELSRSNSQNSNASKKRDRNESDSDDSFMKSKRAKYIGSDSDVDNYESDEGPIVSSKSKKRSAIIDSDSDGEENFSGRHDDDSRDK